MMTRTVVLTFVATAGAALAEPATLAPVPVAVSGVKTPVLTLHDGWTFRENDGAEPEPIEVPGEWAMQGFEVPKYGWGEYRSTFHVPADWAGGPVGLRFDAVHAVCEVALNGKDLGGHNGGFVPFELDAGDAVTPGENTLVVRVRSESEADTISCISQYAAHQVGGIVRKVRLIRRAPLHVAAQTTSCKVPGDHAELTIATRLAGGDGTIQLRMLDPEGRLVFSRSTIHTSGERTVEIIGSPRLWTSETPSLYTLETTVTADDGEAEIHRRRIGLREVRVEGDKLLVNGRPVKLFGVNRHEIHPLRGRSLTPELCRKDAEMFRAANVNLVRTSHYPPSEEFLDACDELGMFVECEAAVCWIGHHASPIWKTWDPLDRKFLPAFRRAALEMITAFRGHPSVILWSPANESRWTPLFDEVIGEMKDLDPTRPVVFHDQCWGGFNHFGSTAEVANMHYPGPNSGAEWKKIRRPLWFGEFAHVQAYNRRELATDPQVRSDWGRRLGDMVDKMWAHPNVVGGAIWSGIDDVFHLPGGDLRGYGHWGVIDAWRREKPETHGVFMAFTPFKVLETDLNGGARIKVANRFNFTDLTETTIEWAAGGRSGRLSSDIAPHAHGWIDLPQPPTADAPVALTVTDRRGVVVAREVLRGPATGETGARSTGGDAQEVLAAAAKALGLAGPGDLLPVPMILPLNGEGGASGPAGSVLANEIAPFTPMPENVEPAEPVTADDGALEFPVSTADAEGTVRFQPAGEQALRVSYQFTVRKNVDPRQWGLVFTLPRSFDKLGWEREAAWSWYPEHAIDRDRGSARANPMARRYVEEPGVEPETPWPLDANALGTAEFRSTKKSITRATLSDNGGRSFLITDPTAATSVRAWVDGDRIHLLVAGFHTGGSDGFFRSYYAGERRPLKQGDQIEGTFELGGGHR